MNAEQKEKYYANVEEQTVLLRSIAEGLAAFVAHYNVAMPAKPLEVKSESTASEFES